MSDYLHLLNHHHMLILGSFQSSPTPPLWKLIKYILLSPFSIKKRSLFLINVLKSVLKQKSINFKNINFTVSEMDNISSIIYTTK